MPRKKKTAEPVAPKPAEEQPDEWAQIPEEELPPGVENVLQELGADVARVVLYRRLKGERQAYVGTVDADEFSLDFVARTWGGGRYVARFSGASGGFIKGLPGYTFYIDESIKPEPKKPRTEEASGDGLGVAELIKLLLAREPPAPQKDPMEIAAALSQSAAAQAQAMTSAMIGAMTPLLAKITELSGQQSKGGSLQEFMSLVDFAAERFGGAERDSYLPVIEKVGVPLVKFLTERGKGSTAEPETAPATTVQEVKMPPKEPAWVTAFRPYVPKLIMYAQQGDDPGMWAQVLDREFPAVARWLDDAVMHPQFTDELFRRFPELVPHSAWVREFLAEFGPEEPVAEGEGGTDDSTT